LEDWVAILDLTTLWEFADIKSLALRQISLLEVDPVDRIVLGHQFRVEKQWAFPAYISLCSRTNPLSVLEATKLGVATAAMIAIAREKLEGKKRSKPNEVKKVVCEVFSVEAPPEK
jgi:hypothetical protein